MRQLNIPKFLFYPNTDHSEIINHSYFLFQETRNLITKVKKDINIFFSLNNFTLIYFYIGNYFIKNKLRKTLKNLIHIEKNFYIISNINLSFKDNLNIFINEISKNKKYNIHKIILKIKNNYYLPLDIINLTYYYFLFFSKFLFQFKLHLVYLNLNLLNSFHILKKYNVDSKSIN